MWIFSPRYGLVYLLPSQGRPAQEHKIERKIDALHPWYGLCSQYKSSICGIWSFKSTKKDIIKHKVLKALPLWRSRLTWSHQNQQKHTPRHPNTRKQDCFTHPKFCTKKQLEQLAVAPHLVALQNDTAGSRAANPHKVILKLGFCNIGRQVFDVDRFHLPCNLRPEGHIKFQLYNPDGDKLTLKSSTKLYQIHSLNHPLPQQLLED